MATAALVERDEIDDVQACPPAKGELALAYSTLVSQIYVRVPAIPLNNSENPVDGEFWFAWYHIVLVW